MCGHITSIMNNSGSGLATFSKNQNGYYKFNNSLRIQWGYVSPSASTGTVTFPTAFSSATSYGVSFMCVDKGGGVGAHSITFSSSTTRTNTAFYWQSRSGSGGAGALPFTWIAVGY